MKKLCISLLLIPILAGCATVRFCDEGVSMVDIENTGWYLFNFIPLASGDPNSPNDASCRIFSDTVTLENNLKLLDYAVRKKHALGYRDATSYTTDENALIILLKRRTYHTSAELITASQAAPTDP